MLRFIYKVLNLLLKCIILPVGIVLFLINKGLQVAESIEIHIDKKMKGKK